MKKIYQAWKLKNGKCVIKRNPKYIQERAFWRNKIGSYVNVRYTETEARALMLKMNKYEASAECSQYREELTKQRARKFEESAKRLAKRTALTKARQASFTVILCNWSKGKGYKRGAGKRNFTRG